MSADHRTSVRVYERLKQDILTGAPGVHGALNISLLARQHRTSATPVREALLRLVGEGHVTLLPSGGFGLRAPSGTALAADYRFNLTVTREVLRQAGYIAAPAKSQQSRLTVPQAFADIAGRAGSEPLTTLVDWLNDRLSRARAVEHLIFPDLETEAFALIDALFSSDHRRGAARLDAYHSRRIDHADALAALLK